MAIHADVDVEARRVRFTVSGSIEVREVLRSLNDVALQFGDVPVREILSDHRSIDAPITPTQLNAVVGCIEKHAATFGGACFAVVTGSQASYGMMRMMTALLEPIGVRVEVFSDIRQAREWLEKAGPNAGSH